MIKILDISTWQGAPNFEEVKKHVSGVMIRSSYGTGNVDRQFERSRNELRRLGIPHGFYHYAYPDNTSNDPEREANFFCNLLGDLMPGEIMVLDFEENWGTPAQKVDWCNRFLCTVRNRFNGYKPMLYINLALAKQCNWAPVINNDFGLWLARWDYNFGAPAPQTQWPVVAMRQYTDKEQIPGISGGVDANVFYGSVDTFKKYGYLWSPPQPEPTPDPVPVEPEPIPDYIYYAVRFPNKDYRFDTYEEAVVFHSIDLSGSLVEINATKQIEKILIEGVQKPEPSPNIASLLWRAIQEAWKFIYNFIKR